MKFLKLSTRLKGFSQPDTTSQIEGYIDTGEYEVLEERLNFPTEETDYVRILAPGMDDSDTWICTRWKKTKYAVIEERELLKPEPIDFSEDYSVPESRLTDLLPEFYDYTYTSIGARYPYPLRGINLRSAPPSQNNCCTFVEALVVKAWQDEYDDQVWSSNLHRLMMINGSDIFGPITALVDANFAMPLPDVDSPPPPWTVIQGWTRNKKSGHTFIILDHHEETDRVLTLESNNHYKLDGVGFRNLGNLRDLEGNVPDNWWENRDLKTWRDIKSRYTHRQQASLKVTNLGWF